MAQRKKQYEFGNLVVKRLGELVGEMKQIGLANGLKEEEIKVVWLTTFEILARKSAISVAKLSQGVRRKI